MNDKKMIRDNAKPVINVTPLIDVLLVLLIIFMVASPIKPSAFKAKVPPESNNSGGEAHINTLVVTIKPDLSLKINGEENFGTVAEPSRLITKLSGIFRERLENGVVADGMESRRDLSDFERIEKTVFIKSPRHLSYGKVAKVVDAVKESGAQPIGLQVDHLQ